MDITHSPPELRELLRILIRRLGFLERSEANCCGITLSQCHSLIEIGRAGSLSVNQLAERLGIDKSTVSRIAEKLVTEGYILRQESRRDRRYVSLCLTEQGQTFYNETDQRMNDYFSQIMAKIEPPQRKIVLQGLTILCSALDTPNALENILFPMNQRGGNDE